jgi:acetyltransferase
LAADWVNEIRLDLGRLSATSAAALRAKLPRRRRWRTWIELSAEAGPEHFSAAIAAAGADGGIDGVLVICSPRVGVDAAAVARVLIEAKRSIGKPLLACWMGDSVGEVRTLLNEAEIPSFRTPESAVGAFGNITTFYQNQQLLQQTPPPLTALAKPDIEGARW